MHNYLNLLHRTLNHGEQRGDRTGTGTKSFFGPQLQFNLADGFPAVTTKKLFFKGVVVELLWLLSGSTNVEFMQDNGVHIWDAWADEYGELGPVYGKQWREWQAYRESGDGVNTNFVVRPDGCIDQIAQVIESIKHNPFSRRHIVSAWNVADIPRMKLPPCHLLFQFYVHTDGRLSCKMTQRSADMFLGVPFNIASYALLTHMIAAQCNLKVGTLTVSFGDAHVYNNHVDQVREQLTRVPIKLPELWMCPRASIDDYEVGDFKLVGYKSHPAIKAPIAV